MSKKKQELNVVTLGIPEIRIELQKRYNSLPIVIHDNFARITRGEEWQELAKAFNEYIETLRQTPESEDLQTIMSTCVMLLNQIINKSNT